MSEEEEEEDDDDDDEEDEEDEDDDTDEEVDEADEVDETRFRLTGFSSIFRTTSRPASSCPNTTCLLSSLEKQIDIFTKCAW